MKLYQNVSKRLIAVWLCLSLLVAACSSSLQAPNTVPSAQRYDGETIFRGIYFGEGPVAEYFPEIWQDPVITEFYASLSHEELTQVRQGQAEVLATLSEADPGFSSRFAANIQSGDPVRVMRAFDETKALIEATYGDDIRALEIADVSPQCGLVKVCVVAAAVHMYGAVTHSGVAAVQLVAVAAYAIYAAAWLWGPGEKVQLQGANQLYNDLWIARVTERLEVK